MWVNDAVICSGGNLNGQTTVPPAVGGTLGSAIAVSAESGETRAVRFRPVQMRSIAGGQLRFRPQKLSGLL
jgi:hypothetical protein